MSVEGTPVMAMVDVSFFTQGTAKPQVAARSIFLQVPQGTTVIVEC